MAVGIDNTQSIPNVGFVERSLVRGGLGAIHAAEELVPGSVLRGKKREEGRDGEKKMRPRTLDKK